MNVRIQPQTVAPADDLPCRTIEMVVNGERCSVKIQDRQLLLDVVREELGLTGTHVGCYNGDCGCCTMRVDGEIVKSCLMLAASADGSEIVTIEGYSPDGILDDLQRALWEHDAFQCGFCVPGNLFALSQLLDENPQPTEDDVRHALIGNLCRCTGYVNLVKATLDVAERRCRKSGAQKLEHP